MKNLNQRCAVDGLLLVALFLMLAFGAFAFTRISDADKTVSKSEVSTTDEQSILEKKELNEKNENQTEQEKIVVSNGSQITDASTPEDWVAYKNEDLGFAFHHPNEWGDPLVSVQQNIVVPGNGSEPKGTSVSITFTENAFIGLV